MFTHSRTTYCIVALAGLCAPLAAWGQAAPAAENPHVWEPATTSVAVFKNGFGYFTREGEAVLRDGWCVTEDMPPASFGTFAVYTRDEGALVDLVGVGAGETVAFDGRDTPDTVEARRRRIEACRGLRVELAYTARGADLSASGTVADVGDAHVVLEGPEMSFAVPIAAVRQMRLLDHPVRVHVSGPDGAAGPSRAALGMGYLAGGIYWVPEYTLRVLDEETAELTLRGTLVNDAEDLVNCDVHFVVGAPNFAHAGQLAPLAARRLTRSVGAAVEAQAGANTANIFTNASQTVQWVEAPAGLGAQEGSVAAHPGAMALPEMGGPAATDYTVYTREGLTVRRGESAAVTLFVKRVRYAHVYRWDVPASIRHYLRLENQGDTAWTTGPCLAVSGDRPLSEDMLLYTPRRGNADFPVTAAINISSRQEEREGKREFKAQSVNHGESLDLVTLEGVLSLANYERKPVALSVSLPVEGNPVAASDEGRTRLHTDTLALSERRGSIAWDITLTPGETRELTYQYERYVPSR